MNQPNDWIEHDGVRRPYHLILPEGTCFEAKLRTGEVKEFTRGAFVNLEWVHGNHDGDIIAYRIKLLNPPPLQEGEIVLSAADVQATREWAKMFLAATDPAGADALTVDDYKEVLADKQRLTKELDVLLNGEGGAAQPGLCDIVAQVKGIVGEGIKPLLARLPDMQRMGRVKMSGLESESWQIAGYAIQKGDRFGMVTTGGRVLWWNEIMGERIGSAYGVHVDVQIETGSGTLGLAQALRDRILSIVDEAELQHGVPESDWLMSGPEALAALMEPSYHPDIERVFQKAFSINGNKVIITATGPCQETSRLLLDNAAAGINGTPPIQLKSETDHGHINQALISANGQQVYVNAFGWCAMTCIQLVQKVEAALTGQLPIMLKPEAEPGVVRVEVSGYTGSGKSALAAVIYRLLDNRMLDVEWEGGAAEENLRGSIDWDRELQDLHPKIRIIERNVAGPFVLKSGVAGQSDAAPVSDEREAILADLAHPKVSLIDVPVKEVIASHPPLSETLGRLADTAEQILDPGKALTCQHLRVVLREAAASLRDVQSRVNVALSDADISQVKDAVDGCMTILFAGGDYGDDLSDSIYRDALRVGVERVRAVAEAILGEPLKDWKPFSEVSDPKPLPECPTALHDSEIPLYGVEAAIADRSKPRLVGKTVFVWSNHTKRWSIAKDQLHIGIDSEGGSHD